MQNIVKSFNKDARNIQIAILTAFLVYGIYQLNWAFEVQNFLVILIVSVATQLAFIEIYNLDFKSIKSAIITGLGLCLLLKTNAVWIGAFAAVISIAVKFLIRVDGKHFFNPSNFGIVVVVLLTGQAWVSPGQWGGGAMTIFLIGGSAMFITIKVRQLGTGLAFIITLFILEYCRTVIYMGWQTDVLVHKFANGALLLFTFFMITDPVSTPRHPIVRIYWASAIAVLTFYISTWYFLNAAPIYVLFCVAPLTPIINKLFPYKKFQWINSNNINPLNNENHEKQIFSSSSISA